MRRASIVSGITRRLVLVSAIILVVALVGLSELSFRQRVTANLAQAHAEAIRIRHLAMTLGQDSVGLRPTLAEGFESAAFSRVRAANDQREIDPSFPNLYFMLNAENATDGTPNLNSFAVPPGAVTLDSGQADGFRSLRIDPSKLRDAGIARATLIVGYAIPIPPPYRPRGAPLVTAVVARTVAREPMLPLVAVGLGAILFIALVSEFVAAYIRRRLARRVEAMVRVLDEADRVDFAGRIDAQAAEAELARLGDATNALLARVAEAVDQFRRLSTHIAHDLRTPILVAMKSTRALHETLLREGARTHIDAVHAQLELLEARLARILTISAVEGYSGSRFEEVDLKAEVVLVIDDLVADRAAARGCRFSTELESCRIWGGRELVQRMLLNLLDNSARHAPRGSEIRVRLGPEGPVASLEISNPVGPDDDAIAATGKPHPDSFGLGLPFARSVAGRHGGHATSTDDGGRFLVRVTLPLLLSQTAKR